MPIRSLNLVGGLLNFSESLGLHAPEVRALRGGGGVVSNTKADRFEIRPFYLLHKRGFFLANPTKTHSPHQLI